MFLLRGGATPQQALEALDEAHSILFNAQGHPRNPRYDFESNPCSALLEAVPEVEVRLGNAFDRQWIAETLFTPRYWNLMQARMATAPVNNAASNERRYQMERLEQIKADVQELATFAAMGGTILVIDTNTLMHANPLEQIVWTRNGIAKGEMVRVLVPLAVIAELDRKKFEAHDNTKKKAADAIRRLYKHRKGLNPDVPASFITTDNTTLALEIPRDDLGRTRTANTDDEIRDFGVFVKQITGRPVTVVTRDMNLQIKCQRVGLEVLWLADDDMKQTQPN